MQRPIPKVAIIGTGAIGSNLMEMISTDNLASVVAIDIDRDMVKARVSDLHHGAIIERNSPLLISGSYEDLKGCDVVVITAGKPVIEGDEPGSWSRTTLLNCNCNVIVQVSNEIKKYAPEAFVVVVANPVDILTYVAYRVIGCNKNMICGMSGILDSARFAKLLSEELRVSPLDIQATVIGPHCDLMLPDYDNTAIRGIPLMEFVEKNYITLARLDEIRKETINIGKNILIQLKGRGTASIGPAAGCLTIVKSYLRNEKRLICSSYNLKGVYDYPDVFMSMPAVIGRNGVERLYELKLHPEVKQQLDEGKDWCLDLIKLAENHISQTHV